MKAKPVAKQELAELLRRKAAEGCAYGDITIDASKMIFEYTGRAVNEKLDMGKDMFALTAENIRRIVRAETGIRSAARRLCLPRLPRSLSLLMFSRIG